jgi:hypothetical protein
MTGGEGSSAVFMELTRLGSVLIAEEFSMALVLVLVVFIGVFFCLLMILIALIELWSAIFNICGPVGLLFVIVLLFMIFD